MDEQMMAEGQEQGAQEAPEPAQIMQGIATGIQALAEMNPDAADLLGQAMELIDQAMSGGAPAPAGPSASQVQAPQQGTPVGPQGQYIFSIV